MTGYAGSERRARTSAATDHAHLEGRMDLLDRDIREMREDMERLDKKLDEQKADNSKRFDEANTTLQAILVSVRAIELGNKDQQRDHALLAQRVTAAEGKIEGDHGERGEKGERGDRGDRGDKGDRGDLVQNDPLLVTRARVFVAFQIAAMLFVIIVGVVWAARTIIRPEALETAGKVVETVK